MQPLVLSKTPKNLVDIIRDGFKIFQHSFGAVFPFALLYSLFNNVPKYFMPTVVVTEKVQTNTSAVHETMLGAERVMPGNPLIVTILVLVIASLSLVFFAALLHRMENSLDGQGNFTNSLMVGSKKILSLWGFTIIFGLSVIIGFVLLVIPGIYILVAFYFGIYALVLRNTPVFASFTRSRELVKNHWWRTALVIFGIIVASLLIYGIVIYPIRNNLMIRAIVEVIFAIFLTQLATSIFLSYFYDLEARFALLPKTPIKSE